MQARLPDNERKGKVHEAAMAAVVLGSVTVNQLLLTQGHQISAVDGVCSLNGSCCRERPARTTLQHIGTPFSPSCRQGKPVQCSQRRHIRFPNSVLPQATRRQCVSLKESTLHLLLVLDLRHGALLAPVDAGRRLVIGVLKTRRLASSQTCTLQLRSALDKISDQAYTNYGAVEMRQGLLGNKSRDQ